MKGPGSNEPCSCALPLMSLDDIGDPLKVIVAICHRGEDGLDRAHCPTCNGLRCGPPYPSKPKTKPKK